MGAQQHAQVAVCSGLMLMLMLRLLLMGTLLQRPADTWSGHELLVLRCIHHVTATGITVIHISLVPLLPVMNHVLGRVVEIAGLCSKARLYCMARPAAQLLPCRSAVGN